MSAIQADAMGMKDVPRMSAVSLSLTAPAGAGGVLQGRFIPALLISLLASSALFWLMYTVIHASGHGVEKSEVLPTIDFVRLKRDTAVETLERRKPPPPPPPKQPPPPQKMQVAAESVTTPSNAPTPFALPNLGLSASVGGGPYVGQMGGGAPLAGAGLFDGDIIPLQRINPIYPRDAARAGITGWVQLEITVNPDGTVRSAKVLEAKPKGLFEAAAVQAVMKWKFKPKVENGQPVEQRGKQKIDFNLNAAA